MNNHELENLQNLYRTWSGEKLVRAETFYKNAYEKTAIEIMLEEIKSRNLDVSVTNIKSMIAERIHNDALRLLTESGDGTLIFNPVSQDGFPLALSSIEHEIIVSSVLWHEHFFDIDAAIELFIKMLGDECRMRYEYRGNVLYKVVLELKQDNHWIGTKRTGLLFFPFWEKKRIEYKQNNVLKS